VEFDFDDVVRSDDGDQRRPRRRSDGVCRLLVIVGGSAAVPQEYDSDWALVMVWCLVRLGGIMLVRWVNNVEVLCGLHCLGVGP